MYNIFDTRQAEASQREKGRGEPLNGPIPGFGRQCTWTMLMKNGNYVQNELLDISFFELIIIQPLLAHS